MNICQTRGTIIKMYEKECEICGTWFEAVREDRKYCDKCQKNSSKYMHYLDRAIERSKARTGEDYLPYTTTCSNCGKKFATLRKWADKTHHFCTQKCLKEYKEKHPASKTEKIKIIPKKICKGCGKEFESPNTYCSRECYLQDIRKHKEENNVIGDISLICKGCSRTFVIHKDKLTPKCDLPKYCSVECRRLAQKTGARKNGPKVSEAIKEIKTKERQLDYQINGLCGYCRTPYADCERMQTNFRVIPKGARFNKEGKIIKCPKFKE